MTPLCTSCGRALTYWRAIDRVPVDRGAVKDARLYGCVPCRRMYRVTMTAWHTGAAEHRPTAADWRELARRATPEPEVEPSPADRLADAVLRLVKAVRDEVRPRHLDPIPTGPDPVESIR